MRLHRTLSILPLTVFATLLTTLAHADFQDGLNAYEISYYVTAHHEWLPLAEQGHAKAQVNLGVMYDNGEGVPQDYAQAHMWTNLAAAQGEELAVKNRKVLENKMTPEQIAEAQRLAREWVAQHQQ